MNNFRADVRIPKRLRASLDAYKESGYDRGHLVSSANQIYETKQNSEKFLLSNMSPQTIDLNRYLWKILKEKIRIFNDKNDILETYDLTAPVFRFNEIVRTIDGPNDLGISVPVPHAFVKIVLADDFEGRLNLWTFLMENCKLVGSVEKYMINTYDAEELLDGKFWDRIGGDDLYNQKKIKNNIRT